MRSIDRGAAEGVVIGKLCMRGASGMEISKVAISEGMKTLRQDGFAKAIKGITSLEEISRIMS